MKNKEYELRILGESIRECGSNVGTIISVAPKHMWGDVQIYTKLGLSKALIEHNKTGIHLPIYAYVHSGTTIQTTPFSCPWDSFFAGYIVLNRKRFLEKMGYKRITAKRREEALKQLKSQIDNYDQYIREETYGYEIFEKDSNGNASGFAVEARYGYYSEECCKNDGENELKLLMENK
jgi:hypothetical protein